MKISNTAVVLLAGFLFAGSIFAETQSFKPYFPGKKPGKANAVSKDGKLVLSNQAMACSWDVKDNKLNYKVLENKLDGTSIDFTAIDLYRISLFTERKWKYKTLESSDFTLDAPVQIVPVQVDTSLPTEELKYTGISAVADLTHESGLKVRWTAVLRDDSNYIRQQIKIKPVKDKIRVYSVAFFGFKDQEAVKAAGTVPGVPLTYGNFFFGYESPLSKIVKKDGLVYSSLIKAKVDQNVESEDGLVMGVAVPGQMRRCFLYYIERTRACPSRTFLHYNSWYDITPILRPYNADQFAEILNNWGESFIKPFNVVVDTFALDDGWDTFEKLWTIDKKRFPDEFQPHKELCDKYGSSIGLWLSPHGGYGRHHGPDDKHLPTHRRGVGQKEGLAPNGILRLYNRGYYTRVLETCRYVMSKYGVNYFKFDGFGGKGDPEDMSAARKLCKELRRSKKNVYINVTNGSWPSPFWLQVADCTWRGGRDSNQDTKAAGSKTDQWMCYRDGATYEYVISQSPLYPLNSIMNHGIIFARYGQNGGPYHPDGNVGLKKQVRSYFGAGSNLQELYVSYTKMDPEKWAILAEGAKWARANRDVFVDTHWIDNGSFVGAKFILKPSSSFDKANYKIYGWASWIPRKGIITLRNPSDKVQEIAIDLQKVFELPEGAPRKYSLKSPWKEDADKPAITMTAGKPYTIKMKPFEILNLEALPH
ncbi:hypothetical protein ACFLS1_02920 [Verrucomicrobiota bacterium]